MPADDWPWGPDGVDPTFNFCDCCGVEFGYQDATLSACRQSRRRWIEAGTTWADASTRPEGWSARAQLAGLPDRVR